MKKTELSPHDGLFKKIFKDRKNAGDFLVKALPENVVSELDLGSLRVEDVSYVDENLKKHFSDVVLSADLKRGGGAGVYLLLEHKSAPAALVGLQLLRYMALKWTDLEKSGELVDGKLPPIVPVVFYQGRRRWKVFKSFRETVAVPSPEFEKYAPDFDFEFFDVPGLSGERLDELKHNAVLHFYLAMLKALRTPGLNVILPGLVEGLLRSLGAETAMDHVRIFFRYMAQTAPEMDRETMRRALDGFPQGGEKIMNTLAEQWRKEGIAIGEKRGELKYARKVLLIVANDRFDMVPQSLAGKIEKIESREILDELIRKTLKCESLERLEGWIDRALGDR